MSIVEFLRGLFWPPYLRAKMRGAFNAGWSDGRKASPIMFGEPVWVPVRFAHYVGSYARGYWLGNQGLSNPYGTPPSNQEGGRDD